MNVYPLLSVFLLRFYLIIGSLEEHWGTQGYKVIHILWCEIVYILLRVSCLFTPLL